MVARVPNPRTTASWARATTLLIAAPAFAGCQGLERIDEDDANAIPDAVQQAFDQSCNTAGCHDSSSQAGGLSLQAPESAAILETTSNDLPMVEIGNVGGSYLAMKILGSEGISGAQMPARGPIPEDDVNLSLIIGWIAGVPVGEGDDLPVQECVAPDELPEEIDYDAHIAPIFEAHCGGGPCHADAESTGFQIIDIDPEVDLINAVAFNHGGEDEVFVAPGSPADSYLWHRLLGTGDLLDGVARRMPLGADPLCADEMELIYRWIIALEPPP